MHFTEETTLGAEDIFNCIEYMENTGLATLQGRRIDNKTNTDWAYIKVIKTPDFAVGKIAFRNGNLKHFISYEGFGTHILSGVLLSDYSETNKEYWKGFISLAYSIDCLHPVCVTPVDTLDKNYEYCLIGTKSTSDTTFEVISVADTFDNYHTAQAHAIEHSKIMPNFSFYVFPIGVPTKG